MLFQKGAPDDFPDLEDLANVAGFDPTANRLWVRNSDGTVTYITSPVDAAADVGSLRTLGNGAQQAKAGDHGHDASEISGVGPAPEDGAASVASLRTLGSAEHNKLQRGHHNHNITAVLITASTQWTIPIRFNTAICYAIGGGANGSNGRTGNDDGNSSALRAGGGGYGAYMVLAQLGLNPTLNVGDVLDITIGASGGDTSVYQGSNLLINAPGTDNLNIFFTVVW